MSDKYSLQDIEKIFRMSELTSFDITGILIPKDVMHRIDPTDPQYAFCYHVMPVIRQLLTDHETMRRALAFYADKSNWSKEDHGGGHSGYWDNVYRYDEHGYDEAEKALSEVTK